MTAATRTEQMHQWKLGQIMGDKNSNNHKLSRDSGFSVTTIRKWRASEYMPKISGEELERLAKALGCTSNDLTGHGEY